MVAEIYCDASDSRQPFKMRERRFGTIVADPPWKYSERGDHNAGLNGFGGSKVGAGVETRYNLMPLADIKALDIGARYAEENAHLYLWTTVGFVDEAFDVMRAWGFTYKTMLTWVKPANGIGRYFRVNTEHVLFGVRGKLMTQRRNVPTAFAAPRTKHSEKPAAFFDLVETHSPGPYLSIFERRERMGWDAIGDELGSTIAPVSPDTQEVQENG